MRVLGSCLGDRPLRVSEPRCGRGALAGRPGSYHVALGLCGPIRSHPVGGRGWLRGVGLNVPSSVDEATREHRTMQETESESKAENADNTLLISIHHSISSASEHRLCLRGTDQKPHIRCALSASPSLYFLVQPLAFNCPDPPLPCPSAVGPLRPPASAPDALSAFFPPRLLSALPVTLLLAHVTVGWGHSDLHPRLLQAPEGGQALSRLPQGTRPRAPWASCWLRLCPRAPVVERRLCHPADTC